MKITHLVAACALIVSTLTVSQTGFAFNKAGDLKFALGGGYDYFASTRHLQNTAIPYGIIGYNFTDQWGGELLLGGTHTNSKYVTPTIRNVSVSMFAFDVAYHFTPYSFVQPYLLAGPGVMGISPNGNDAHNEVNINAAAGLEMFAGEALAFRVELRDLYTFVGGKNDVYPNAAVTFLIPT